MPLLPRIRRSRVSPKKKPNATTCQFQRCSGPESVLTRTNPQAQAPCESTPGFTLQWRRNFIEAALEGAPSKKFVEEVVDTYCTKGDKGQFKRFRFCRKHIRPGDLVKCNPNNDGTGTRAPKVNLKGGALPMTWSEEKARNRELEQNHLNRHGSKSRRSVTRRSLGQISIPVLDPLAAEEEIEYAEVEIVVDELDVGGFTKVELGEKIKHLQTELDTVRKHNADLQAKYDAQQVKHTVERVSWRREREKIQAKFDKLVEELEGAREQLEVPSIPQVTHDRITRSDKLT
jgi:hypothetical protein